MYKFEDNSTINLSDFVVQINNNFQLLKSLYMDKIANTNSFIDNSLENINFANSSVLSNKICSNAITESHLANNSINTFNIQERTITIDHFSNQNIIVSNFTRPLRDFMVDLKGYYITNNISQTFQPNSIVLYYQ